MKQKNRIYVGMDRPDWNNVENWSGYILCTCGNVLQTKQSTREHWQMGHFDKPIYKKIK